MRSSLVWSRRSVAVAGLAVVLLAGCAGVGPSATVSTTTTASGVAGTVRFGPVCPVERIPADLACAPRPGAASIRLDPSGGRPAITGTAGADGRFSIPAPPGVYAVSATATAASPGRGCSADPPQAMVVAGTFVTVSVLCDTGIR